MLFDLDGTVTEPFEGISKSILYAVQSMGISIKDINDLRCFIGPPLFQQFKEFFGFDDKQAEYAVSKYRERYGTIGWSECHIFNGIEKLLIYLKKQGFVLAVATSKPEKYAVKIIDKFNLSHYFDFIGGAELAHTGRNEKSDIIAYVGEKLNIKDKSAAIMVGDRFHDIEGARANGIKTIAVLWGYGDRKEFEEHNAEYIAENTEKAAEIVVNWRNNR